LRIAIVGLGKVGTSLGILFARAGQDVVGAVDTEEQARQRFAERVKCRASENLKGLETAFDLLVIAVPDRAIKSISESLSRLEIPLDGRLIGHTSGALGSDELADLRKRGCFLFSMHPIQTFASIESAVKAIPGSYFALEGDPEAVGVLEQVVTSIGAIPVRLGRESKPLYHASLSVASNFLVALLDLAVRMAEAAGIKRKKALEMMLPLVRTTLANFRESGAAALTGPIERGDLVTVEEHLRAIGHADSEILEVYAALSRRTVGIARDSGRISREKAEEFFRILGSVDNPERHE
jgi:predicted short-subunit dehydrogenase-like oxidoreductase (DUF2520 family)